MPQKVAIERDLDAISNHMAANGLQVDRLSRTEMTPERLKSYGAVVICGQDNNFMGMEDKLVDVPVFEATGKTAEELTSLIKERLQLQQ